MNFNSFPDLGPPPQFLPSRVEVVPRDDVLGQAAVISANISLFHGSSQNVNYTDCDNKTVYTSGPHHITSNDESRPSEWINVGSNVDADKKSYESFAVLSHTNQSPQDVWPTKVMMHNASTMTDVELPENLCKNSDMKYCDKLSKALQDENGFSLAVNEDSCSRIHLQRQENAMAIYLARLQRSSLPLCIQQFLNRHDIKPEKNTSYNKKGSFFKPRNSEITVATSLDGSTLYCCPECRMAYSEKEPLEAHMAVHKSERRFKCNVCGACLKRKEHLDQHKRRHSEDRPFVCDVCFKGFKRNEHLRRHCIIHSGNKMHSCSECGKAFSRKDHLNKHALTHVTKRMKSGGAVPMNCQTCN